MLDQLNMDGGAVIANFIPRHDQGPHFTATDLRPNSISNPNAFHYDSSLLTSPGQSSLLTHF